MYAKSLTRLFLAQLAVALLTMLAPSWAQTTKPTTQPANPATPKMEERKSDEKAIQIVDRYLEYIGGKARLSAIRTRHAQLVNRKFQPTGVTEMKMVRYLKNSSKPGNPLMVREEWELPGMGLTKGNLHFTQVYNGERGWVKTMGVVSPLTGKTLTVFVWDKPIGDSFMQWEEDGYILKYKGASEVDGFPVDTVQTVAFASGQRMSYSFSKEDGSLLKKQWQEVGGPRGNISKEVYFYEYQKLRFSDDGNKWIRFPVDQKIYEDGELSLEKEYQKLIFNGDILDTLFDRPEGPAFEERPRPKPGGAKPGETKPANQPKSKPKSQPKSQPGG